MISLMQLNETSDEYYAKEEVKIQSIIAGVMLIFFSGTAGVNFNSASAVHYRFMRNHSG